MIVFAPNQIRGALAGQQLMSLHAGCSRDVERGVRRRPRRTIPERSREFFVGTLPGHDAGVAKCGEGSRSHALRHFTRNLITDAAPCSRLSIVVERVELYVLGAGCVGAGRGIQNATRVKANIERSGRRQGDAAVLKLASQIEDRLGDKAAASRYVQRIRAEFPDAQDVTTGGNAGP